MEVEVEAAAEVEALGFGISFGAERERGKEMKER